jgi:hypothetical protein
MVVYYRFEFRASWPLLLRAPGVYEARVHGPGAFAETLIYPMPSTIAGAFSALAASTGPCGVSRVACFEDLEDCLGRLVGGDYSFWSGVIRVRGGTYYNVGRAYSYEALVQALRGALAEACFHGIARAGDELCGEARRAPIGLIGRTGIEVSRSAKAVLRGMLYTATELDVFETAFSGYLVTDKGLAIGAGNHLVKLGGDQKPSILALKNTTLDEVSEELGSLPQNVCGKDEGVLLVLTSKALLEESPLGGAKKPLSLTLKDAETLASELLGRGGLGGLVKPVEPYVVQVDRVSIDTYSPGWSSVAGYLRKPHLVIPEGVAVVGKCLDQVKLDQVIVKGLGDHTSLGWGSVLPIPASRVTLSSKT